MEIWPALELYELAKATIAAGDTPEARRVLEQLQAREVTGEEARPGLMLVEE